MEKQDRGILILILIIVSVMGLLIFSLITERDKKIESIQTLSPTECVVEINYLMSDLERNKQGLIDLQRISYGDVDLQRLHLLKIEAVKVIISKDKKTIDELEQTLNKIK